MILFLIYIFSFIAGGLNAGASRVFPKYYALRSIDAPGVVAQLSADAALRPLIERVEGLLVRSEKIKTLSGRVKKRERRALGRQYDLLAKALHKVLSLKERELTKAAKEIRPVQDQRELAWRVRAIEEAIKLCRHEKIKLGIKESMQATGKLDAVPAVAVVGGLALWIAGLVGMSRLSSYDRLYLHNQSRALVGLPPVTSLEEVTVAEVRVWQDPALQQLSRSVPEESSLTNLDPSPDFSGETADRQDELRLKLAGDCDLCCEPFAGHVVVFPHKKSLRDGANSEEAGSFHHPICYGCLKRKIELNHGGSGGRCSVCSLAVMVPPYMFRCPAENDPCFATH